MAKKKRAPSAYNKHIGREMKKGATMAEAAASWKKPSKKSSKRKTTSRKKPTIRRVTRRRQPQQKRGLFPAVRLTRSKIRNKIQFKVGIIKGPIWKVWLLDKLNERIGA